MKPKAMITGALLVFVAFSVAYLIFKEVGSAGNRAESGRDNPTTSEPAPDDGGLVASGEEAEAGKRAVVAYYFHGNVRCPTCRKIEAYTAESIKTSFANELSSGQLKWKVVNVDEPANERFVKDYKLTTRSVVLVDMVNGKQVRWNDLARIWDLVGNKAEFQTYIVDETRGYLKKGDM